MSPCDLAQKVPNQICPVSVLGRITAEALLDLIGWTQCPLPMTLRIQSDLPCNLKFPVYKQTSFPRL
jgi:hypothetical protein